MQLSGEMGSAKFLYSWRVLCRRLRRLRVPFRFSFGFEFEFRWAVAECKARTQRTTAMDRIVCYLIVCYYRLQYSSRALYVPRDVVVVVDTKWKHTSTHSLFEGLRYATTVVWFCESDMPFPTDKKITRSCVGFGYLGMW